MLLSLRQGLRGIPVSRRLLLQVAIGLSAVFVLIFCAMLVATGRQSFTAVAFGVALAPVLIYAAVVRPFAFPFALWAALVPFDNLLAVSKGTTATRLLAMVCGAAFLFLIMRRKRFAAPPRTILVWLIYAAWAATSIAWANDQDVALISFSRVIQLVLLYVIVALTPARESDVKIVLAGVLIGGVTSSLFGIWLFHHQSAQMAAYQQQFSRLQIDFGDSGIDVNQFADALLFPLLVFTVGMLSAKKALYRVGSAVGFVICLVALNYSGSRESFVALAAGLAYLFVVVPRYRVRLAVTAVAALGASLLNPSLWLRFAASFATGGSGRGSIWKTAIAAAREHPILGVGVGNFSEAYNSAYIGVFQKYPAGWSRASHDIFLRALVEVGVIGLVIMCVALFTQYRSTDAIRSDGQWGLMKIVVRASMVALIVAAVFIDMMNAKFMWLLFYFVLILRNAPQYSTAPADDGTPAHADALLRSAAAPPGPAPGRVALSKGR